MEYVIRINMDFDTMRDPETIEMYKESIGLMCDIWRLILSNEDVIRLNKTMGNLDILTCAQTAWLRSTVRVEDLRLPSNDVDEYINDTEFDHNDTIWLYAQVNGVLFIRDNQIDSWTQALNDITGEDVEANPEEYVGDITDERIEQRRAFSNKIEKLQTSPRRILLDEVLYKNEKIVRMPTTEFSNADRNALTSMLPRSTLSLLNSRISRIYEMLKTDAAAALERFKRHRNEMTMRASALDRCTSCGGSKLPTTIADKIAELAGFDNIADVRKSRDGVYARRR